MDLVVLLLLVGRAVAFHDYSGFALFMQLAFLYGLQRMRKNLSLILFLYFYILFILKLLVPLDPLVESYYLLFPLSGALAIFFLFLATSGEEHFFTFFFYFINGLYLCFLFANKEAATYVILLTLFLFIIFSYLTYF